MGASKWDQGETPGLFPPDLKTPDRSSPPWLVRLQPLSALWELILFKDNTIHSLEPLAACRQLKRLILTSCGALESIEGIELIPTLEELDLTDAPVRNVICLTASKSLKKIILRGCVLLARTGIRGFEKIPKLEELDVGQTTIAQISHLALCKALKILTLGSGVTDEDLPSLGLIPTLENLHLYQSNVVNVSLLSSCKGLSSQGY
jgi:Leucine-rich repeat (LRR) protein